MKTILTWVIVAAVAIGLAWVVFPWFKDYAGQTREDIDQGFAKQVRHDQVVERGRQAIRDEMAKLESKYADVLVAKEKFSRIDHETQVLKQNLSNHEAELVAGTELLKGSNGPTVVVNGKDVFRQNVVDDLNRRVQLCENLRVKLATAEKNQRTLDSAIQKGTAAITDCKNTLQQRQGELDGIEILLEAGEATKAVNAMATSLTGVSVDVEESRYFEEIRKRLAEANAALEFSDLGNGGGEFLTYTTDKPKVQLDVANSYVNKYLLTPAVPQPAAPVPAEKEPSFLDLGKPVPKPAAGQ